MKDEALKLAKECGATTYTNRHYPEATAVTFSPVAWEKFCEQALAAQPAVQEPIGYVKLIDTPFGEKLKPVLTIAVPVGSKLYTTPPAAQRQWVGLTDEDKLHIEMMGGKSDVMLAEMVEAKLKEKNNG